MKIQPSTRKGKRFMVTFENGKTVHFGQAGGQTYTLVFIKHSALH